MIKLSRKFTISIWLLILLIVIIGSLLPNVDIKVHNKNDKLIHFLAYFLMSLISSLIFERHWKKILFAGLLLLVSALIEVAQHYIPQRSASSMDMLANFLGITCGLMLSYVISFLNKNRKRL